MTTISATTIGSRVASTRRWTVLLGAIIVQLILGTVYGYSIFWKPLTAEVFPPMITQVQADRMIAAGQTVEGYTVVDDDAAARREIDRQQGYLKHAFAICILSFAVVMVFAGRVQDLKGPRFPAILGGVLMGGGFLIAGLMNQPIVLYIAHAAFMGAVAVLLLMLMHALLGKLDVEEHPMLKYAPMGIVTAVVIAGVVLGDQYVGQLGEYDKLMLLWGTVGFLSGAGIGFAYVCPIAALVKWFPNRKGLVAGVAVAGFGLGAYVFKGQTLGAMGFIQRYDISSFFLVHGVICLVGIGLGALLLANPPGTPPKTAVAESSWQETLRRPAFWVLWLMYFSGALAGLMVIGIVSPFVAERVTAGGLSAAQATAAGAAAVGWLSIFNAAGRIVWGFTSDRIGRTPTFVVMFLIQAVVMAVLGTLDARTALVVSSALVGFNYGGCFALFPSACADLFGAKNLGANYGWLFTSYGVAGVVGINAGNMAKIQTGSYVGAFVFAAVLCLISAGLAVGLAVARRRAVA